MLEVLNNYPGHVSLVLIIQADGQVSYNLSSPYFDTILDLSIWHLCVSPIILRYRGVKCNDELCTLSRCILVRKGMKKSNVKMKKKWTARFKTRITKSKSCEDINSLDLPVSIHSFLITQML